MYTPELEVLSEKTTTNVAVKKLNLVLQGMGVLMNFIDNRPQFTRLAFKKSLSSWKLTRKTSSPLTLNPMVLLKGMQTIKKLVKQTLFEGKCYYLALLEYHSTPLSSELPSPAQLLYNRRVEGLIPLNENLLKVNSNKTNYKEILENRKKTKTVL